MTWNGEERRGENRDHDMLTRIDANLSNFMSRFDEHTVSDKEHFDRLYKKTANLQKFLYIAMGAFTSFQVCLGLVKWLSK